MGKSEGLPRRKLSASDGIMHDLDPPTLFISAVAKEKETPAIQHVTSKEESWFANASCQSFLPTALRDENCQRPA
jgi:hypothetical protein